MISCHRTFAGRFALLAMLLALPPLQARISRAAEEAPPARERDVIYGRKDGLALTMDVFRPGDDARGIGVVLVVSGGFFSSHDSINPNLAAPLVERGYTVFAVVHGSQPRYTVPEIIEDMNRAVRYIRHHASEFGIDPDRIGITGASAGGHLSLMLGNAGSDGDPNARDPVDRESSRVQAVACFFPPTDFLNYGETGRAMLRARDFDRIFRPAFDYAERDPVTNLLEPVTDEEKLREITRAISPASHVGPDSAPTLIVHGDVDRLVPLQQSESIIAKLDAAGVPANLIVKPGAGHGWFSLVQDVRTFADWFDEHLAGTTEADSDADADTIAAEPASSDRSDSH